MIKFGVFGDGHLTNCLPYTLPGDITRKNKLINYIDFFFDTILDEEVSFLVVPGDLAHLTSVSSNDLDLLFYFYLKVKESKIPTVFSLGNHDLDGDESILRFLNRANCLYVPGSKIFYEENRYFSVELHKIKTEIHVINFCSHHDFLKEARDSISKKESGIFSLLVGHVGVKGTLHGSTKSIIGVKVDDIEEIGTNHNLIVLGHHHAFQWVTPNCFYSGSVHQTRIDEIKTTPGGVIVETDGVVHEISKIENKFSPRFVIVEDYKFKPKEIKSSIVKPVLNLDSKTEKENVEFLRRLIDADPYYLIKPRIKKSFRIENVKSEFSAKKKLDAIIKTMKSFDYKKNEKKKLKEHIIKIWEKAKEGEYYG